ncbi:MAG: Ldh family oxidoreductase [Pirellulales bacterium]
MPILSADALARFAIDLLAAGGVRADEAEKVGRSLVDANLRGHDSHGVVRIAQYLDQLAKEEIVTGAQFAVLRESDTLLAADGHWGFGRVQAGRLTERLIEKATRNGVAVGTLIRSSHIGRLGEYCELAAAAGLVSTLMVNTHGVARRVAPPGGKAPRLGTNPIAMGAPAADGPLILDFGTSATAEGKVRVKRIAGQSCPPGWLLDSEGRPTTDPATLYGDPPGTILPLGGEQAYKGFGLGLMVEIFAGALSGGICAREQPLNQNGNCVFMQVISPEHLGGVDHFSREISCLLRFVRECPRVDGCAEILLPGDPERRTLAERTKNGIPFDEGNWGQLLKLAERFGVRAPA